ncbi:MAG: InlB B-repeat-containing protein, partial [Youngiibacter sp.]|nr:InlB B-repeat-containing protein [Youngiibacter sp.]
GTSRKSVDFNLQEDGSYIGTLYVDNSFQNGTYVVASIDLFDMLDNRRSYTSADFNTNLSISVSGSSQDSEGPIITSIMVESPNASVGDTISYTINANDVSGIDRVFMDLSYESSVKFVYLELQEDGSYKGSLEVDNTFLNGMYTINTINLIDTLGNYKTYTGEEINSIFTDIGVIVTGSTEDGKIPGLAEVTVSGSPVIDGSGIIIDFDWTGEPFTYIDFDFRSEESNHNFGIFMSSEDLDEYGHVHFSAPIDEYLASGLYELNSVYVYYEETQTQVVARGNVYNCSIEVINLNQDTTPPEIVADSISIEITETEMIIDFDCVDSATDLEHVSFWFSHFNEETMEEEFAWSGWIRVTDEGYTVRNNIAHIPTGIYHLRTVYMIDNVSNYSFYDITDEQTITFQINADDRYTVTLDSQGGSEYDLIATYPNETVSEPYPPEKNGYLFDGWYKEAECIDKWDFENDKVSSDITLFAKWKENTPIGSNVEVLDITKTVNLVFDSVLSGGRTIVEPLTEPNDESFFHIEGSAGFFDIKTTAEFDDSVKITVKYDPDLLDESQVESDLRLYQFKDGIPIDITDPATPVDTVNKTITGILTDHFCVFSVGLPLNHEVNVTYIGSTLTPVSEQKVLSCKVASVDSEINLDYTNVYVEYRIKGTDGSVTILPPVQCNEDGVASVQVDLGADVYSVEASILENGYAAPAMDNSIVVVYDPTGGSVTGGGWIDSPERSYMADLTATGKANFGFVSKYQKGAVVPSGNTEFQFKLGDLNFHSDSYEWLVVNKESKRAQYKGTGTINGSGQYKFMIWATDNGSGSDTFRIKIWNAMDEDEVIYDNGSDQTIGGGQISVIVK